MNELTITIPGALDRMLTPNRGQRNPRAKAAVRARAKNDAFLIAINERNSSHPDTAGIETATYHIEYGKAKGRQSLDQDNLVASLKAALDGIAKAFGVDDRGWTIGTVSQVRDPEGIGYIAITFEWDADQERGAA